VTRKGAYEPRNLVGQDGTLRADWQSAQSGQPTMRFRRRGFRPCQPARESGFAMLLVFLMAAILAITLYWQIPRVAFQAQRQKEQLLIERGEQYQRAIQLFVRANNRYPQKIEDLENFNNRRYLRHKYKDPMTGKDEWRLIHVNAAGVFTDSIANKKKTDKPDAQASQNTFVSEEAYIVPDATQQGAQGVSAATRRRQSEGGAAPVGADGQPLIPPPNQQALSAPPPFPEPGGQPGVPGNLQPGIPGQPGQDPNNLQSANQLQPGQSLIPGVPGTPGQPQFNPAALAGGNPTAAVANNNLNNLNNTSQAFPQTPGAQQPGAPQQPVIPPQPPFPQPGAGALPQPGAGGFPQPGATQNPSQTGGQNANTASSSFVGGGSSFVGSSSSFVGGSNSFVGSSTTGTPAPGNPNPGTQPGFPQPGTSPSGFSQPGAAPGSQPGFAPQNFSQPGQTPGFAQPGGQFNSVNPVNNQTATSAVAGGVTGNPATQSAAAGMLNNILTSPRQGGIGGGTGGGQATTGPQGQQIGAGIAGVASTSEAPAIMEYNQHDHYNEWEFIFDVTKQKQTANPMAANGVPGTPAGAIGSVPGGTPGTPVGMAAQPSGATATASPFGAAGPTSSPFGATPGTTTASATAPGTPGQTTPGGVPGQQQSLIPPWFRFGEP
jgi:type II secretory pathway pseudopilin PulG